PVVRKLGTRARMSWTWVGAIASICSAPSTVSGVGAAKPLPRTRDAVTVIAVSAGSAAGSGRGASWAYEIEGRTPITERAAASDVYDALPRKLRVQSKRMESSHDFEFLVMRRG